MLSRSPLFSRKDLLEARAADLCVENHTASEKRFCKDSFVPFSGNEVMEVQAEFKFGILKA